MNALADRIPLSDVSQEMSRVDATTAMESLEAWRRLKEHKCQRPPEDAENTFSVVIHAERRNHATDANAVPLGPSRHGCISSAENLHSPAT